MFARSQLGDHSPVSMMHINLGGDDRRQDMRTVFHHRRSGLIARGFNAQNNHKQQVQGTRFKVQGVQLPGLSSWPTRFLQSQIALDYSQMS